MFFLSSRLPLALDAQDALIVRALDAPCPTLVLRADRFPRERAALRVALSAAHESLVAAGHGDVLKIALVAPSGHPLHALDYRFVQVVPGRPVAFDLAASCGHSALAAVYAAVLQGWLPRMAPGARVPVLVLNNNDRIVCEIHAIGPGGAAFTAHVLKAAPPRLGELLPTGAPVSLLTAPAGDVPASLVDLGNPYAFVDAGDVGVRSRAALFADDPRLFKRLLSVRDAAGALLGYPAESVLPKIAAVGAFDPGRLAVRAVSVPTFHPTLALTGAGCLGAATAIAGTIPARLAKLAGCEPGVIQIDTPGGPTGVAARLTGSTLDDRLEWTSVANKRVERIAALALSSANLPNPDHGEDDDRHDGLAA